jgi:hypothetical protein
VVARTRPVTASGCQGTVGLLATGNRRSMLVESRVTVRGHSREPRATELTNCAGGGAGLVLCLVGRATGNLFGDPSRHDDKSPGVPGPRDVSPTKSARRRHVGARRTGGHWQSPRARLATGRSVAICTKQFAPPTETPSGAAGSGVRLRWRADNTWTMISTVAITGFPNVHLPGPHQVNSGPSGRGTD